MISHFSVILLCLSGAYCILSKIERLDLEGLKRVLTGETPIEEWATAMSESVTYKGPDGVESTFIVRNAVRDFKQNVDNSSEAEFLKIRDIIKLAYQCTLSKYASFTTFLIVQELLEFKRYTWGAIQKAKLQDPHLDTDAVFKNEIFKKWQLFLNFGRYYLDLDFKFNGSFQFFNHHIFNEPAKQNIHLFWDEIIQKMIGLKIKYKVYSEVMSTKFWKDEFYLPINYTLKKLICVLNEAVRLFDNFIVNKCAPEGDSFLNKFKSLTRGFVHVPIPAVLKHFDTLQGEDRKVLISDITKSIPETPSALAAIEESGCFVEDAEFEISGITTVLSNDRSPADIYGTNFNAHTSVFKTKVTQTIHSQPLPYENRNIQIAMLQIRDEDNLNDFVREYRTDPSRPTR
ncbi:uncharacterized protein LOC126843245 [Adelges cooleyi]|uniref:uncharacterized protein LOC126843245 n=1 Tax=Adelges cooleyi TaxID=133065 RepID=UPI00217FFC82|nr:uncharacterized protein LOC126843245 [Adelges cooleyi]